MISDLYEHQNGAVDLLRNSFRTGHKRPIVQAPTAFGKTKLAAAIIESALGKGKRILMSVPAIQLVDQTVASLYAEGITDVGVIQAQHYLTNTGMPVQVASVQTLMRRPLPVVDLVIIDECHKRFEFYSDWMANPEYANLPFIGLSATPWTKGLGKDYDDLLIAATTADLIEKGFLSPFKVFAPSHPDLRGVKTVAGDYHEGQLSAAMQKPQLIADAVDTWLTRAEGRPTFVYGVDCAHAALLQERFKQAGVETEYIDAHTPLNEREIIRQKFQDGAIKVVCNVGCLTTGIDWDVRCISLCRPTKSEILYTQIIGRGLRIAQPGRPPKDHCLILDHSDTTLRLGFVTNIIHTELDDGKPKAGSDKKAKDTEKLPQECIGCGALKEAGAEECPSCGMKFKKKSKIIFAEGDLVELDPWGNAMAAAPPGEKNSQDWYQMFVGVARQRGYKRGWAAANFRDKFGVWPPRGYSEIPMEPDAEVLRWVRHKMIQFAKRRAA